MMEPFETQYFNWLCSKVMVAGDGRTDDLLMILHCTEFVWVNPYDENRAYDGLELRRFFFEALNETYDPAQDPAPCSVLEMLIAFAQRAEFQTDIPARDWFWLMLRNLGLDEYRRVEPDDVSHIADILHVFMFRIYNERGDGGLWPLQVPVENHKDAEIFYQFSAYVTENQLI